MSEEEAKRIGIWVRVSTEDQVRGESPEHHERRARAYAEAKGWTVVEVFRLEAVSGKAVMQHPEAQRMLRLVRGGAITGLVFSKLARLARNTRELLEFAEIFREAGADLISLQEAIDTSTPAGRLFFTMIAAMAQWEREEIVDRVRASVPVRAKLGKPLGGAAPYGYRWRDKKLEPDPVEAPIRTLIHELFREHRRKKTVARILTERGYRTRRGAPFSDSTIDRLLLDTTAKGVHRANYTATSEHKGAWTLKPESEWVYTSVDVIVSEELWDECARILMTQKAGTKRVTKRTTHLFSGLTYCACGAKMYVRTGSPKYVCEACRTKIPAPDLEAIFKEQLRHIFFSPDEIESHNQAAKDALLAKERVVETTASELRRVLAEDQALFDLYVSGTLSKKDFGRRHAPISVRIASLEAELPRLQAELDVLRITAASREEVLGEARDLMDRWDGLAAVEKRQVIEAITERIVVGREDVEIALLHLPNGEIPDQRATRPQGFWAATSCTRAG
ncbi:recombinase family protein [Brevundimonas sp. 2R-24]|uniref:Recombinase family protein n=1 Tax=Peiella sedimenti TaxID=3061083 RepID=A0ABT8SNR6_9CAUL|nr:recombinase family protein [Caulobacteraceae bacterium XZ-24]